MDARKELIQKVPVDGAQGCLAETVAPARHIKLLLLVCFKVLSGANS